MTNTQRTAFGSLALLAGGAIVVKAMRAARRFDFRGKSVLIVGGSRGLGLLVARQLAAEGARLTLAARDRAELDRARAELAEAGAQVDILEADIAGRDESERLVQQVVERTGGIDVLINNAGIIAVGPLDHMHHADFDQAMAVHFWGPLHTMLAAIPFMRRQGGGRIVNVSSIGGKIGVPHLAPYCASKFALAGLSQAMRAELMPDNISVTAIYPGLMRTGSPFNAWFKGRNREEFTWFTLADSLPGLSIDARRAAAQLIEACRYGEAERVISYPAKAAVLASALAPEFVAQMMALANSLILPSATDDAGTESHSGWQSRSAWAPSTLTRLTERAARENNEVPQ
jgi:NAD(P)-dependent dehydrogenase (short-subunit alcohol dehydrogenase family)